MKITGIDIIELRVPGWRGDSFDGSRDDCVIRVHTDEGITGIAEVDSVPSIVRAVIEAPRSMGTVWFPCRRRWASASP
jgi:hypothetical protein